LCGKSKAKVAPEQTARLKHKTPDCLTGKMTKFSAAHDAAARSFGAAHQMRIAARPTA
jgi:hypothetical protein